METNEDVQYLKHLAGCFDGEDDEIAARLREIADVFQALDEKCREHMPNDYALGYMEAMRRMQGRANIEPERTSQTAQLADILSRAPVTKVPYGARTINPVTGKTYAEEAREADERRRHEKHKPVKPRKPSLADEIDLDLSSFEL